MSQRKLKNERKQWKKAARQYAKQDVDKMVDKYKEMEKIIQRQKITVWVLSIVFTIIVGGLWWIATIILF